MTATDAYPAKDQPSKHDPSCQRCFTRAAPLAEWWRAGVQRWVCRNRAACRQRQARARRARKGTR